MTLIKFRNEGNIDKFPFIPTVFGDFFNDFLNGDSPSKEAYKMVPAVNISERPNDFVVEVAAPGIGKDDFKISVENGVLSIAAEKKEEKKDENSRYTRREFSYSTFKRSFSLPEHVDADKIAAAHADGVLTLTLPKREEARTKAAREIKVS